MPSSSDKHGPAGSVLTFHKLSDKFSFGSTNYSPRRFDHLLEHLQARGYRFAALCKFVECSTDANDLILTFDDAYEHLLPVLESTIEKYQFRPMIFVPTAFLGRMNDWDYSHAFQKMRHIDSGGLRRLVELGAEIGVHGHTHRDLTQMPENEVRDEVLRSKSILEDATGKRVRYISYPFGRHNKLVRQVAQESGLAGGFTMSYPNSGDDPMARGRKAIYGFDTDLAVDFKLRGGVTETVEKWKGKITNRLAGGTEVWQKMARSES